MSIITEIFIVLFIFCLLFAGILHFARCLMDMLFECFPFDSTFAQFIRKHFKPSEPPVSDYIQEETLFCDCCGALQSESVRIAPNFRDGFDLCPTCQAIPSFNLRGIRSEGHTHTIS